jgi:siroheme synthase-like protein
MKNESLSFLPVSINITNRKILIVGGGKVAYHKASILSRFTSNAAVISPEFHEGFASLPFELVKKEYQKEDLAGIFLAYICTENQELNAQIKRDTEMLGVLASVCDNPSLCDFISPAIFKSSNVAIAVSSNAKDVCQAINIRNQIKDLVEGGKVNLEIKADDIL